MAAIGGGANFSAVKGSPRTNTHSRDKTLDTGEPRRIPTPGPRGRALSRLRPPAPPGARDFGSETRDKMSAGSRQYERNTTDSAKLARRGAACAARVGRKRHAGALPAPGLPGGLLSRSRPVLGFRARSVVRASGGTIRPRRSGLFERCGVFLLRCPADPVLASADPRADPKAVLRAALRADPGAIGFLPPLVPAPRPRAARPPSADTAGVKKDRR